MPLSYLEENPNAPICIFEYKILGLMPECTDTTVMGYLKQLVQLMLIKLSELGRAFGNASYVGFQVRTIAQEKLEDA